jgi:broad specificity phosphatase PhoE
LSGEYFFVIRHGDTQANLEEINAGPLNYPLSKKGKQEVDFLAKKLAKAKITDIYSSPIFRAVETAKILARPHKLRVQTLESLTEAKLKAQFVGKKGRLHILTSPESFAETYQELEGRMVSALSYVKSRSKGNAIIVSHGDPIAALLSHVVERKIEGKRYYVLHPDPASLSIVEITDRPRLVLFNYHRKQIQRSW